MGAVYGHRPGSNGKERVVTEDCESFVSLSIMYTISSVAFEYRRIFLKVAPLFPACFAECS